MSSTNYKDLNIIKTLYIINGKLVNKTPLRVGGGRFITTWAPVDIAVYRVNGIPIIPGSSLKGAFRSYVEMVARSLNIQTHSPFEHEVMENEKREGKICPVCGIFGGTHIASHVRIYDSKPIGEIGTFLKTGVSIDRDLGTAKPQLLYTEELVPPETKWSFRMDIYNIELDSSDDRARLLNSLLNVLKGPGLQVGARKSVGCGLLILTDAELVTYRISEDGRLARVG